MSIAAILNEKLSAFQLDGGTLSKFQAYATLLAEYNKRFNLTAIENDEDVAVKHFLDSMMGLDLLPEEGTLLDIGSGAGFPGLVIAIARPSLSVTLMDSNGKKAGFLQTAIRELDVKNASVTEMRAEVAARDKTLRESFDVATARAVAPLNELLEYALPLIKKGGAFVAYKGKGAEAETENAKNAARTLFAKEDMKKTCLLDGKYERTIVRYIKYDKTDILYPRENKRIKSNPL